MNGDRPPVLVVATIGSGLVAGAFAVFSLMVVPALTALPGAAGAAAMQSVNRTAVRPGFMTLLFGTALVCLALGGAELAGARRPAVLTGVALYLFGVVGVTVLANVPLNDALARLDAAAPGAAEAWRENAGRWTRWNTVRSLAATGAATAFLLASAD
ncbi:DUF1772 domain-containing protein [Modestobacter sp. VKM Ac-2977]|uniref:anthrone oxygenase family protein n=1 Tax=Modestobacter sp. VKM Ac-2977 TaxID=3004131 RepID=UPI0022AAC495|nr:anthrone oxygenase family protein [Modestobacter sp. VKM Ac-2977]MCZ2819276.1 DUF1772 domain-containing protein [Modestobacter sp. VKM Ac-2977]